VFPPAECQSKEEFLGWLKQKGRGKKGSPTFKRGKVKGRCSRRIRNLLHTENGDWSFLWGGGVIGRKNVGGEEKREKKTVCLGGG